MSDIEKAKSLVPEHSDSDRLDHLLHHPSGSAHLFDLLAQGRGTRGDLVRMIDRIIESRKLDNTFNLLGRDD